LQGTQVLSLALAYFPVVHNWQESVLPPTTTMLPTPHWGHGSLTEFEHPDLASRLVTEQALQVAQAVCVFTTV
jgi:hypothetical protein